MAKDGLKDKAAREELIAERAQLIADNFEADGVTRKRDFVPHDISRIAEIEESLGMNAGDGTANTTATAETADYQTLKKMAKRVGIKAAGTTEVLRAAVIKAREKMAEVSGIPKTEPDPPEEKSDQKTEPGPEQPAAAKTDPPAGETDAQKIKRLEKANKTLTRKYGRSAAAAKMRSVDTVGKHVKRPDEIMEEALDDAEDRDPADYDESNRVAVEREIRKYVKKGGVGRDHKGDFYDIAAGFRKGITLERKKYCLELLEKMGRLTCTAAEIVEVLEKRAHLSPGEQRQTAKEHNAELQGMGVTWDDEIQVPGMSAVLR